ncbi:MAG: hypothetical protein JKY65_29065 [Planctomycetes bacterium]|nr:hypothetical protein [Planctomycetota bacterium]
MRNLFARCLFALGLAIAVGCSAPPILVDKAPPPPKEESEGRKPAGDVFWMSGHWAYDTGVGHYFWVGGQWALPRPGRIWQSAYWEPTPEGKYRWVPERWDRLGEE